MAFREILQHELEQRRGRNARYSLRAFARALALDHASLSQILRGKRRLTPRTIRRLGAKLRVPPAEIEQLCGQENDRAVLRAIAATKFRPASRWIAAVTGIPVDDVNISLQRLVRTGVLLMTSTRHWEVRNG